MVGILVLFALGGYYTINGAIGLGRQQIISPAPYILFA